MAALLRLQVVCALLPSIADKFEHVQDNASFSSVLAACQDKELWSFLDFQRVYHCTTRIIQTVVIAMCMSRRAVRKPQESGLRPEVEEAT